MFRIRMDSFSDSHVPSFENLARFLRENCWFEELVGQRTRAIVQMHRMQEFDLVTGIPSSLACLIFQDWLTVKCLMALNSAYCSKAHRKNFVAVFLSDEYVIQSQVPISGFSMNSDSSLLGLLRRKNIIQSVWLVQPQISKIQLDILLRHVHCLTQLYIDGIHCMSLDIWALVLLNPHILSLKITWPYRSRSTADRPNIIEIPEGIQLPNLRELSINGIYMIPQVGLFGLLRSTGGNLLKLDVSYCTFSSSTLLIVSRRCPQLKALSVAYIDILDPEMNEVIAAFNLTCPFIEHLNIEIAGVHDDVILSVAQNLKGLQSLCIRRDSYFQTDNSLLHIYTHCASTLHTLYLTTHYNNDSPFITPRSLNTLLETCTLLRTFYWRDYHSEDAWFVFSPAALCNLTTLVLYADRITESNLKAIGMHAQQLQVLALQYVSEQWKPYSYEGLEIICIRCLNLRELYIDIDIYAYDQPEAERAIALFLFIRPSVKIHYLSPEHLE